MTRVRPIRRRRNQVRHQVRTRVESNVHPGVPSPAATSARWRSPMGRRMSEAIPLTPHASTAWADQAAKDDQAGRQGDAQVCVTGCRQCGHARLEGSRRHLNRCQDVRANRSTGQPKAWRWSGNCTDWLCKYGYHHTIVLQSSRLDAETRLAKGHAPLESPPRTSPSVDRLRSGFVRAFCIIGQNIQPCSKWQRDGCPLIIAILIRNFLGNSAELCTI
jgi:hypothetical protein